MMRFAERYIESAAIIIANYTGNVPFQHHLKQYFSANKKFGSKDRKAVSHACYCYFRLGQSLKHVPLADRIKAGIFLCQETTGDWISVYNDEWKDNWKTLDEKIGFLKDVSGFNFSEIFFWHKELSEPVEHSRFSLSHLVQPDLYLRIRPGKLVKVKRQLQEANILFKESGNCIALANSTRIEAIIHLNKDAVVQDYSSQRIAEFFQFVMKRSAPLAYESKLKVWDCCAASGGKSILAVDVLPSVHLTATDVRPSIIQNLKKRFAEAGIRNYNAYVADVSEANRSAEITNERFDLIICDAPCSGSGTWGRTPEQLSFFQTQKIAYYSNLQKKIAVNASHQLSDGGFFLYITCSVFKSENEDVVKHIEQQTNFQLVHMELLKGYDKRADSMFAALFQKK